MAEGNGQTAPICVYGSTGYTGRLVVRELRRRGLPVVLSGRDEDKLRRLAIALGGDVPIRPARVGDAGSLRRAFEGCAVVASCAGPFSLYGEPVVAAAVAEGAHYLDTTGEQGFIKQVLDAYDARAGDAGVAVVPAMGFDFAPGDMIAHLVAQGLEPLDELTLAYAVRGMRATRGTMLSVLEVMRRGEVVWRDGRYAPAPHDPGATSFDFPEPAGRKPVMRYPSGEVLTVPRHVRTRNLDVLLTASTFAPERLVPALPAAMSATSLLARTPAASVVKALVSRLPEGPSEEQRRAVSFVVVAEARAGGRTRRGVVRGSDVYGTTAVTVAEGAARMAEPGYERSGALAPAEAFDPASFLGALGESGLTYEVEPLPVATAGAPG